MKNIEIKSFANAEEIARAAATDWLNSGAKSVALSGGRIAASFYSATVQAAAGGRTLAEIDYFWADERCLLPTDAESNYRIAKENLFDKLPIPDTRIHRLKGELPPEQAAEGANEEIESVLRRGPKSLPMVDIVFLGLGEDGHVASMMPNVPESVSGREVPFVAIQNSPKPPPNRLSMTYAMIAEAKQVWVLANGAGKTVALRESLSASGNTPLARVIRSRAMTVIYTDVVL